MKCCLYGLVGGRGSLYTYNHREAAVFQFLELERLVLLLILGLELVAEAACRLVGVWVWVWVSCDVSREHTKRKRGGEWNELLFAWVCELRGEGEGGGERGRTEVAGGLVVALLAGHRLDPGDRSQKLDQGKGAFGGDLEEGGEGLGLREDGVGEVDACLLG